MTFRSDVWGVDGNQIDAQLMRLMNTAALGGNQGVIGHLDCIVNATGPATSGIVITAGGVGIQGVEASYQGSYTAWNVGSDTTVSIAATGASARSDMIIARAEDPTWSGSPWGGAASAQIVFPRVWSNCPSNAKDLSGAPTSWSAIPLARIDMPPSTAAVQQAYITDLRQVANPQRTTDVVSAAGPSVSSNWTVGTPAHAWPPGASWQVPVPFAATSCVITWDLIDLYYTDNSTADARGNIGPVFGASVSSPNLAFPQTLVSVQQGTGLRVMASGGVRAQIPPSLRGTTQTLQFSQNTDGVKTGRLTATEGSQYRVLYQFQQLAALV